MTTPWRVSTTRFVITPMRRSFLNLSLGRFYEGWAGYRARQTQHAADAVPPSIAIPPLLEEIAKITARLAAFGDGPYVGVTWRAGTAGKDCFLHKEVPAEQLASAVAKSAAGSTGTVVVTQRNPAEGEVGAFARALGRPVLDLSALNPDLEAVLGLRAVLDIYVGVSSANVYLRDAARRPSHVMVPYPAEFRWLVEGQESPCVPGAALYRQDPYAFWNAAMTRLTRALEKTENPFRIAV